MKSKRIIIIIVSVLALILTTAILSFIFLPESFFSLFYVNDKKVSYGEITVKLKDGYNYDLSGRKYALCPYCGCCEEGMCDWHCEASADAGLSCGCFENSFSLFDIATFSFPDTTPIEKIDNESDHYKTEDLFSVYVHVAKKLTDKKSLSDDEIISIADCYKKLLATINHNTISDHEYFSRLPEMPEIYGDMKGDICRLLLERDLIFSLDYINESVASSLAEYCLDSTGVCPMEKLSVVCVDEDRFYVFSDSGYCYFDLIISRGEHSCYTLFNYSPDLSAIYSKKLVNEMMSIAVGVTDTDSEIPVYRSGLPADLP